MRPFFLEVGMTISILDTERLRFRLMTSNDAELFYELDQDPEVMRYINGGQAHDMETTINQSMPRLKAFTTPEKGWGYWQLTEIQSNEFVGWILIRPLGFFDGTSKESNVEIGWRLKQKFWGKGFATEGAKQVMAAIAKQPSVTEFTAVAFAENSGSINIMQKLGMSFVEQSWETTPNGKQAIDIYNLTL